MDRREFLGTIGAAAASAFVPRVAVAAGGYRNLLVLIELKGGNDGLNTVVPVDNGLTGTLRTIYQNVRVTGTGGLQIPDTDLTSEEQETAPPAFDKDSPTLHAEPVERPTSVEDGHVLGSPGAPVTIVEYSDFQ